MKIIILICLAIILAIYLLVGFICYGFCIGDEKYQDNKTKKYLGLSKEGLKFKADTDNTKYKLLGLFVCTLFGCFYLIVSYIKDEKLDMPPTNHGFSIW